MFCGKCGNQIAEGISFCPKCGNRLAVPSSAEEIKVPIPEPETIPEIQPEPEVTAPTYPITPATAVSNRPQAEQKPAKVKKKKGRGGLVALFITVGILLIAGITVGILFMVGVLGKEEPAPTVSVVASVKPEAVSGSWEANISYDDFTIGKPVPAEFDHQFKDVYFRFALSLDAQGNADIIFYKSDLDSAALAIYETLLSYRLNEFYQSYTLSGDMATEDVDHMIQNEYGVSTKEYVASKMNASGLNRDIILSYLTTGLTEIDGRTWLYKSCSYTIEESIICIKDNAGNDLISMVYMGDGKMTVYEANENYAFINMKDLLKNE